MANVRSLKVLDRSEVSAEEWEVRKGLAALYRLVALNGWDDMLFTHISARAPGPGNEFLINPFGMYFREMTASSLVRIDLEGNILSPTPFDINYAGFVIHSAIHAARHDANYVVHLHTNDGVAVASQRDGLLAISQRSIAVRRNLSYHDFEGVATDLAERERIVRDLGDKSSLILRNHGTLAVGPTPGAVWLAIYALEKACTEQVRALSAGPAGVLPVPEAALQRMQSNPNSKRRALVAELTWAAELRRLADLAPGYDS